MNFICTENVKYSSVSAWIWVKCIHIYLAEKVAPSISFYPRSHEMLCLIFFEVFIVHDVQSMQIHVDSYLSGTKWTRLKSDFQIKKWITIGSKFMCCCLWPQFSAAVNWNFIHRRINNSVDSRQDWYCSFDTNSMQEFR